MLMDAETSKLSAFISTSKSNGFWFWLQGKWIRMNEISRCRKQKSLLNVADSQGGHFTQTCMTA